MKTVALSIEQMKHLESLGLDTSDANMYYSYEGILQTRKSYEPYDKKIKEHIWTPAYTLQNILEKLYLAESEIFKNEYPSYCINVKFYKYFDRIKCVFMRNDVPLNETTGVDALEAAYEMLVWCINNEYKINVI